MHSGSLSIGSPHRSARGVSCRMKAANERRTAAIALKVFSQPGSYVYTASITIAEPEPTEYGHFFIPPDGAAHIFRSGHQTVDLPYDAERTCSHVLLKLYMVIMRGLHMKWSPNV